MSSAELCERQPEERGSQLMAIGAGLVLRLAERGLLADCGEPDAGVRAELIAAALGEAYSHGFDAGFRLQINARGRAGK